MRGQMLAKLVQECTSHGFESCLFSNSDFYAEVLAQDPIE